MIVASPPEFALAEIIYFSTEHLRRNKRKVMYVYSVRNKRNEVSPPSSLTHTRLPKEASNEGLRSASKH